MITADVVGRRKYIDGRRVQSSRARRDSNVASLVRSRGGFSVPKTMVITGAGAGLGRALARRFVADGESVVLLGRGFAKVQAVAQELGERALALECDVSSPESVRAAFEAIAKRHERRDGL